MLTVFHTADWHLGQSFFGFDRDFEHQKFLEWLLLQLESERPDILLISGDVFDTINPSATAQRRFFDFLAQTIMRAPATRVIITAGNHDAAARLEAPSGLLESLNISVIGTITRLEDDSIDVSKLVVPVLDSSGIPKAIVIAMPFLRPSDLPFLTEAADPWLDGTRQLYRQAVDAAVSLRQTSGVKIPLIAMGHCHVQGGQESRDSERRLVIGGAEALAPDVFPDELAYTALGHLHKAQHVGREVIRYSGSPIPLSFSESGYKHRILKLTFNQSEFNSVESLPIPREVGFISIPPGHAAEIDEVLSLIAAIPLSESVPAEQHPFLEVRVLETGPDPARRRKVEQALEGKAARLASIKLESVRPEGIAADLTHLMSLDELRRMDPEHLLDEVHRSRFGTEPDEALVKALKELLSAAEFNP